MQEAVKSPVLTVSEFTGAIKRLLESNFREVILQGEVSNFKEQSSGHLYFSLKDNFAQISAVMFRGDALRLKPFPKSGDQVIVKGEISLYEPRGSYQIIVRELYYVGLGALLLKLEELKVKLREKGWFDVAHKKSLPKFPKRIGVITSPTGAAIQDILNILNRRYSGFHLILNPVKVQGEGAAQEIADAIIQMNKYQMADVLIVGRGGGSIEDLWPFNEEIVAKAIFESHIPIISAVGHESDTTLADFVADVRAPTPSAAAEIVIGEKTQHAEFLAKIQRNLRQSVVHIIKQHKGSLFGIMRHPVFTSSYSLLGRNSQKLDTLKESLEVAMLGLLHKKRLQLTNFQNITAKSRPTVQLIKTKEKLLILNKALNTAWQHRLSREQEKLKALSSKLILLDPKNLLRKGYAILFSEKDASLIISSKDLKKNDKLIAKLADGEIKLIVGE